MIEISILKKINKMISVAIELTEIDNDSTLIILRKVLESLLKQIYQIEKIEKPAGPDGYTSPDLMLKDLLKRKIITNDLYEKANVVRKNGNDAVHKDDNKALKSSVKESLKSIAVICEWFLRKYKKTNNSLYYLMLRHAKINKNKITNKATLKNIKLFEEFIKLSVFKNNLKVFELYDELEDDFYIDDTLYDFLEVTYDLAEKYYYWKDEYDQDDYKQSLWEIVRYGKQKTPSPKEAFLEYYEYEVESYEEAKEIILQKYLLNK